MPLRSWRRSRSPTKQRRNCAIASGQVSARGSPTHPRARRRDLLRNALDGLDAAAISTLHGFARRILAEHAIEAGLPPRFEALDQIASEVDFAERWDRFTDELFDDPASALGHRGARRRGCRPLGQLNEVGVAFNSQLGPHSLRRRGSSSRLERSTSSTWWRKGRTLCDRRRECRADDDRALARFGQLDEFVARLAAARDDAQRIAVLTNAPDSAAGVPKIGNVGSSKNWFDLPGIRAGFVELRELCSQVAAAALSDAIALICDRIARFTLEAAEQRHAAGRLEFHDLLVRARDLLRHSPPARASLHRRHRQILLDESQDTDPIQIEIATLIAGRCWRQTTTDSPTRRVSQAANPPSPEVRGLRSASHRAGCSSWAIRSSRSTDSAGPTSVCISRARARFGTQIGSLTKLQVNFRSAKPIIDWVNAVFADLIDGERLQCEHRPATRIHTVDVLAAGRQAGTGGGDAWPDPTQHQAAGRGSHRCEHP